MVTARAAARHLPGRRKAFKKCFAFGLPPEGIYWGIENNVDIINMSFGTEVNSEALHNAVKAAADAGILLIAAAGNNAGKGILYPAAYSEVIAVGATTNDGTILSGSATGSELELLAPGSQIISTGMVDGYTAGSGTSLATAEVTGIASLLLAQPGAAADMVRGLLGATAKDVDGTDAGLVDYGYAKEHFAEYLAAYQSSEVDQTAYENPADPGTYDTEGIVNGLWSKDNHKWLADKAQKSLVNTDYITNVAYAAYHADDPLYHTSAHKEYNGLHGMGAYTANLYTLWKYANYIGKGETIKDAYDTVYDLITNEKKEYAVGNMMEGVESGNPFAPMGVLDVCKELLSNEKTVGSGDYETEKARKKYLVVGFGCHMIGDIYAHRTLVPEYVFDMDTKDKDEYGENLQPSSSSSSYDARLGENDFENWGNLVTFYNGSTTKNDGTVVLNRLKFTFPKLDHYKKGTKKLNEKYEDNPNFCRERFAASLSCTKAFLSRISSADNNSADPTIIEQEHLGSDGKPVLKHVVLIHYNDYMPYFANK